MRARRMAGGGWGRAFAAALVLAAAVGAPEAARAQADALHVPSPDWRDQVIYFAMIDRFADGDPANNDQGGDEYDPRDNARWSGGDLRGLRQRLDYIRGLGATALWITPPVANQWWNPHSRYGGYHGYWATDFKAVDPHYGTLEDYRDLSRALHGAGMYLIQDVVVNHTADFFGYAGGWDASDPARHYVRREDGQGLRAPTRRPFSLNDPRDPAQRAAAIYHWTPAIADFADRRQELTWQLADLDDLNTQNPQVRRALRDAYGEWIREVGVDGFRVDTAFYVEPEFFRDFLHAEDPAAPGVARIAAATGRGDFHVFGEGFGLDRAYADVQARRIAGYLRDADGPLLPGMINFPLYGTLLDVFARGRPGAELGWRIENTMRTFPDPHRMPTFVDNHDVDRFLAGGDEAGLKQALLAILTLPGIPTIYYGTEQGLREQRAALFAGGYGSGGRDRYDTGAPLYRWLQRAIALRREHRVFSRGTPQVAAANAAAPGGLVYLMRHDGQTALVAFNTAAHDALIASIDTGLAPGTVLRGAFDLADEAAPKELVVGAEGRVQLVLPAHAGRVWLATPERRPVAAPRTRIVLDPAPARVDGDFLLSGRAPGARELRLVVDGDLARARIVRVQADGRWQATIDTADMVDSAVEHQVLAWDAAAGAVSQAHTFHVERKWTLLAEAADPEGDDAGPAGRYRYPTASQWRERRPLDLRHVRVYGADGALRIEIATRSRISAWNSPNGFDHAAYTVFVELPGRADGARVMPQQNAALPGGMRWHLRARAHGWSNALFASDGADAQREGRALTPAATLALGPGDDTVSFVIPARALGRPAALSGARVYVNVWDYDGGYRALQPEAGGHTFGGGDGRRDPLWMDAIGPVVLR